MKKKSSSLKKRTDRRKRNPLAFCTKTLKNGKQGGKRSNPHESIDRKKGEGEPRHSPERKKSWQNRKALRKRKKKSATK